MALTVSNLKNGSMGTQAFRMATITFDTSYVTGGESLSASSLGLSRITRVLVNQVDGYTCEIVYPTVEPSSVLFKMWEGGVSGFTPAGTNAPSAVTGTAAAQVLTMDSYVPAGTNSTSAVTGTGTADAQVLTMDPYTPAGTNSPSAVTGTGTADAQVFTGTSTGSLDLATPAFSGTSYATAGQVITTTDNQTMTLNECAGMWFIGNTPTEAPALIVSNTAVSGAPAVLTVIGAAPVTDSGNYSIVKNVVSSGTNASSALSGLSLTAAAQAFSGTPDTLTGTNSSSALSGLNLTAAAQPFIGTPDVLTGTNAPSAVTGTAAAQVFTGTPVAGAASSQVPNGTNLSSVTMEVLVTGY